jgi:hypothetical protein
MGLFDRLFGRRTPAHQEYREPPRYAQPTTHDGRLPDDQAIERYRYLLRTAPPDKIEQAHAEAFAQLTPDQRQQVLTHLAAAVPANERPRSDDPETLARVATRAELRQPGTLERALGGGQYGPGQGYGPGGGPGYGRGGYGGGPSFGSMVGGSLLGTIGGLVIGTAVADALFDTGMGDGGLFGGGDEEAYAQGYEDGAGGDGGDAGGGDFGGGDFAGGDFGGDF